MIMFDTTRRRDTEDTAASPGPGRGRREGSRDVVLMAVLCYGLSLAVIEVLVIIDLLMPYSSTSIIWWVLSLAIFVPLMAIGPLIPILVVGCLIAMVRFPR